MKYCVIICFLFFHFVASANNSHQEIMSMINQNRYEDLKYYLLGFSEDELNILLNSGNFILHKAMINSNVKDNIIGLLLDHNADPNLPIKDHWKRTKTSKAVFYKGSTAAHIAIIAKRSFLVLDLLRGFNTDFHKKDASGWSAVDLAKSYMIKDVMDYFKIHKVIN